MFIEFGHLLYYPWLIEMETCVVAAKPSKGCRRLAGSIAERCFYRRRLMPNGRLDNPERVFPLAFGLRALMANTIDMAAKFLEDRILSRLLRPLGVTAIMWSGNDMEPTGNGGQDKRTRRPVPWPRHVEIAALLAVAFALVAGFYLIFGGASRDARRFASFLGYEDSYVRRCKAGLAYHLKYRKNQRLVQNEVYQDVNPRDVRLAYGAQDPSGAMVRGEFRCLFRSDSAYTSDLGPRFSYIEVDGIRLPSRQTRRIDYLRPMEMQQNR